MLATKWLPYWTPFGYIPAIMTAPNTDPDDKYKRLACAVWKNACVIDRPEGLSEAQWAELGQALLEALAIGMKILAVGAMLKHAAEQDDAKRPAETIN